MTPPTQPRPRLLLRELNRPGDALSNVTPNWFASVMGTSIVANAAALLPLQSPALHLAGAIVWCLAMLLLVVLTIAYIAHWVRVPARAWANATDPVMGNFTGAISMGIVAASAGTLSYGSELLGAPFATTLSWVMWIVGSAIGLITTVGMPLVLILRHEHGADAAFGGWLMPVVPPMVSAAIGAALIPTLPEGEPRVTMLVVCAMCFGVSAFPTVILLTLVWHKLVRFGIGPAAQVPMLFIMLGPLGQSATASVALGERASVAVDASLAQILLVIGISWAVVSMGFAMCWFTMAAFITLRQFRIGLPFTAAWWSFTFPIGTCVTGFAAIWRETGVTLVGVLCVASYAVLVLAWAVVLPRTLHGTIGTGKLLAPPA